MPFELKAGWEYEMNEEQVTSSLQLFYAYHHLAYQAPNNSSTSIVSADKSTQ